MVTSAESFSSKKDYRRLQYHPFRTCRGYRKPSFVGNVLTFPPIGRVKEQLRNRTAARKLYVGGHSIQEQTYIFTQFHETVADEQPAGLDYKFLYVTSAIDGHETLHRQPLNATNVLQCRDLCLNYSSGETICRSFSLCRTESFGRFQCWLRDTPEKEVPSLLRTFGGDNERAAELMRESSREQGCRHFQMQYKNRYHILKNKSGSKSDLISQPEQVMTSEQCVQKCEQTRGAMHGRCRQVQLCRLDSESVKGK